MTVTVGFGVKVLVGWGVLVTVGVIVYVLVGVGETVISYWSVTTISRSGLGVVTKLTACCMYAIRAERFGRNTVAGGRSEISQVLSS